MAARIDKLPSTTIKRRACYMEPDPCAHNDYVLSGEDVYGDPFKALVHRRGRGMWVMETGDLRESWAEFHSLQAVVAFLEDPMAP